MKTTLLVSLLLVTIRRDANTITPITVPAHELPMLRNMHGKENVTHTDEAVGTVEVDPAAEYERLGAKYGAGKVAKVYGDDDGLRLSEMVTKNELKPAKPLTATEQKAADKTAAETATK